MEPNYLSIYWTDFHNFSPTRHYNFWSARDCPWPWELLYFRQQNKTPALSSLLVNISLLNRALFMRYRYYKGFWQQKWPANSLKVIGNHAIRQPVYDFLFVFHCNYISILHRFRYIIAYLPKFKDVTWPWPRPFKGQFVIPMINCHLANSVQNLKSLTLAVPEIL